MQSAQQSTSWVERLFPKSTGQKILTVVVTGAIATTGLVTYSLVQQKQLESKSVSASIAQPIIPKSVTALGRLEPRGEVVKIAASTSGSRVDQLLVKQGDWVKKGQVIAVLDNHYTLKAELEQAKEQVRVNQARLAQVQAGAKTGEIGAQKSTIQKIEAQWQGDRQTQQATINRLEAQVIGDITTQKATIARLQAELNNAQAEYERYEQLNEEGAISASIYDSKKLNLETSHQQLKEAKANLERIENTGQQQINEAKAALKRIENTGQQQINEARSTLNKIAEVRPVDVQTAIAEVNSAIATVKKAQAELALTYVRSPRDGQILKVHTWEGEVVNNDGIVELGETNKMVAVAEVYETDVQRIKLGQKATITSEAFPGTATGIVNEIGLQIYKNNVLNTDPTAAADARIVEVKIQLDPTSNNKLKGFTNLEVTVAIDIQ